MSVQFERVALIGIGLIGSSLAHVMRREKIAAHITGYAKSEETRKSAVQLGLVDSIHATAASAVRDADLVILCVPVGACGAIAKEMGAVLKPGCIVTDVGSVKAAVVRDVAPHLPAGVHFVPGHPIAGTEQSGPASGFADLFLKRWCILTPLPGSDAAAVTRLEKFWHSCGSYVDQMTPEHHDLVLAITSHIPHLVAYNIVGTVADLEAATQSEVIKFSASGFRDFTRIAASDPVMWRDVFLTNRDAVLEMLGRFSEDLSVLQRAVRTGDGPALEAMFTRTRAIRRSIISAGQETAAPDFGRPHEAPPVPDAPVVREHGGGDDA